MQLKVIFQDPRLLVIDKPSGLVSTPSGTQTELTLADILAVKYGISLERGGLIHRLDKDTSGVIVASKDQAAFEALQAQFKEKKVHKEYILLVHGHLEGNGKINAPLARNPGDREKFAVVAGGREAVTKFEVLRHYRMLDASFRELFAGFNKFQTRRLFASRYLKFSLLKVSPETGRTHQIRVHLKYIDHSIVGDEKYGGRKTVRLDHRWCPRQFLHAVKITFKHPSTGQTVSFESPLPQDLQRALGYLSEEK